MTNIAGSATSSGATLTVLPLQPLQFDLITLMAGNQVKLVLSGEPGNYTVFWASNLVDWLPLTNVAKEIYCFAIRQGDGEKDFSAIYHSLARNKPD